jgi:hypothetical protein
MSNLIITVPSIKSYIALSTKMACFSLRRQISKKIRASEAEENEEHSTSSEPPSCPMKEPSNLSRQSNTSLLTPAEAVKMFSFDVTESSTA